MTLNVETTPLFGIGIAGNFAGHLNQTGEAKGLSQAVDDEKPQAIFPFFVPSATETYLTVNPYSSRALSLPTQADAKVQMESEVAVIAKIDYQNGQVSTIEPTQMMLLNDATYRNAKVSKLAEKKNWGEASTGIGKESIPLVNGFDSDLSQYRFCSFHRQNQQWYLCCKDASVADYSYFYQPLLNWLVETINFQSDEGALHSILALLEQAGYPQEIVISLGASRYTEQGESHALRSGDELCTLLYDEQQVDFTTLKQAVEKGDLDALSEHALVLYQHC